MRALAAVFRINFDQQIQYRVAALAGLATQYAFGFMYIRMYLAFYQSNPSAFPLTLPELMSYMWLQQGLLTAMMLWFLDQTIFDDIVSGNVAYEFCRPVDLYRYWFIRNVSRRLARVVLRMVPLFLVAALLPAPYTLLPPPNLYQAVMFVISLALAFYLVNTLGMLMYAATVYTMNPMGVRMLFASLVDLLAGSIVPIPLFPEAVRRVLELLPFGSIQNAAFLIYSGHIGPDRMAQTLLLQVFWCIALTLLGRALFSRMQQRISIQGG